MDFIRTLFSEDVQFFSFGNHLPASRAALKKRMDDMVEDEQSVPTSIRFLGSDGQPEVSVDLMRPTEALTDAFLTRVGALDTPLITDEAVMNVLYEETASFFEGKRSAADTAAAVQRRLAPYLAE